MLNNIRLKYFIVLLLIVLYVVFLNISFSNSSDRVFYNSSDKLWAHRVLNTNDANVFSNTFKSRCLIISSTSLLIRYFKHIKQNFFYYIPDREKDGYGASIKLFQKLILKIFKDNVLIEKK